jgi:hypothetical protein
MTAKLEPHELSKLFPPIVEVGHHYSIPLNLGLPIL